MATSRHSKHHLIVVQPVNIVFSEATIVFTLGDYASFAVLQSRVHESWVRGAGLNSTLESRVRYTPSTCFETFPFPRPSPALRAELEHVGAQFEAARAALCRAWGVGLTKLYNRLLDPSDEAPPILRLRALRDRMDELVLNAYGWPDLSPDQTAEIITRLRRLNSTRAAGKPDPRPTRGLPPAPRIPMAPPSPKLRRLSVRNLKLIRKLDLDLTVGRAPAHVVAFIGENGTGKTALLQALALALAGPTLGNSVGGTALAGLPDRRGKESMTVKATLGWDQAAEHADGAREIQSEIRLDPGAQLLEGQARVTVPRGSGSDDALDPLAEARKFGRSGWFVAGYGVSRALPTPTPEPGDEAPGAALRGLFEPAPLVATNWFYRLGRLDPALKGQYKGLLTAVLREAEGLLPGLGELDPDAKGALSQSDMMRVRWSPAPGVSVDLPAVWLSHGYQSTLAWIADLLGRLVVEHRDTGAPGPEHLTGVVLIDEIDLFLHPTWQVAVVRALKRCLPGLQLILTTHSPLVLAGLRPDQDLIINLRLDEQANVEVVPDEQPLDPRLMTSTELLERYFNIDDVHPDALGRTMRRVHQLGSFSGRTAEQEAQLQEGLKFMEQEGVKPYIPIQPWIPR